MLFNYVWTHVARTEYRLVINTIAPHQKRIVPLVMLATVLLVLLALPQVVPELLSGLDLDLFVVLMFSSMRLNYLMFFLVFTTIPISVAVRDIKTNHMEMVFKAPVKSSDLLLGEFVGKIPFYGFFVLIFSALYTSVLSILEIEFWELLLLTFLFCINVLSAYWLGTVIASVARSYLLKSTQGRDLGKAVTILIILPAIVPFYWILGSLDAVSKNPELFSSFNDILKLLPPTWGLECFYKLGPVVTDSPGFLDAGLYGMGYLLFLVVIVMGGFLFVRRSVHLEPGSFNANSQQPYPYFYKAILKLFGRRPLIFVAIASYKNYFRRFENLSKVLYALGLLVLMIMFFGKTVGDVEFVLMMGMFYLFLLSYMVVTDLTVQGKEHFLFYRQTATSSFQYLSVRFLVYWSLVLPMALIPMPLALLLGIPGDQHPLVFYLTLFAALSFLSVLFCLNLVLLNPPYSDRAPEYMMNIQVVIFLPIGTFIASLVLLQPISLVEIFCIVMAVTSFLDILLVLINSRRIHSVE